MLRRVIPMPLTYTLMPRYRFFQMAIRLMERETDPLSLKAGDVMHTGGVTIGPEALATEALRLLEERRITSLIVAADGAHVDGILHLHDLWGVGLF